MTLGKRTVHRNDGFVAWFQADSPPPLRCLRTGRRQRKRDASYRVWKLAVEKAGPPHLTNHFRKPRVHVADQRSRKRSIDSRVDPEQGPGVIINRAGVSAIMSRWSKTFLDNCDFRLDSAGSRRPRWERQKRREICVILTHGASRATRDGAIVFAESARVAMDNIVLPWQAPQIYPGPAGGTRIGIGARAAGSGTMPCGPARADSTLKEA